MTTQSSEDRVAFTKRNWMGRFLRAEVSYGDVQRIMGRIETWADWLPAWAETAKTMRYSLKALNSAAPGALPPKLGAAPLCAGISASSTGLMISKNPKMRSTA